MTDIQALKQMYLKIGLNFSSCQTLVGHTVVIATETKEIHFEFDCDGKFIRIV